MAICFVFFCLNNSVRLGLNDEQIPVELKGLKATQVGLRPITLIVRRSMMLTVILRR